MEKYGDKPAITTYTSEKEAVTRSYRQLTEDVYALAAAMREKGWQGWHVALAGENSYQWVVAFFASAVLNCPVVLVDIEQSVETIAQMLETADSQVAFASASAAELFAQEADMPKLPLVASGGEYGLFHKPVRGRPLPEKSMTIFRYLAGRGKPGGYRFTQEPPVRQSRSYCREKACCITPAALWPW
ncbi:MAG: AMP-binding protein [[Clostridium] leptum]